MDGRGWLVLSIATCARAPLRLCLFVPVCRVVPCHVVCRASLLVTFFVCRSSLVDNCRLSFVVLCSVVVCVAVCSCVLCVWLWLFLKTVDETHVHVLLLFLFRCCPFCVCVGRGGEEEGEEGPCVRSKRPPCVQSTRPRVYRHQARIVAPRMASDVRINSSSIDQRVVSRN